MAERGTFSEGEVPSLSRKASRNADFRSMPALYPNHGIDFAINWAGMHDLTKAGMRAMIPEIFERG
jgi:hypothetical protein